MIMDKNLYCRYTNEEKTAFDDEHELFERVMMNLTVMDVGR
jgi:hypothetical protein